MLILDTIKEGNRIKHYIVQDTFGKRCKMHKENVIEHIKSGKITNAKIQIYNNSVIIRVKPINQHKANYVDNIVSAVKASHVDKDTSIVNKLNKLKIGTPLKIRVTDYDEFEQVIYLGKQEVQRQESFTFFNGRGVNGYFALTAKYILSNKNVEVKFDDNDPSEVSFLLNYIKKGPFELNNIL